MPQLSSLQVLKRARLAASVQAARILKPDSGSAISGMSAMAVREPVSRRTSVILRVATDAGIEGVSELSSGPDTAATLAAVNQLESALIGRDVQARQSLLWDLSRSKAASPVGFLAALDIALLDIAGKMAKAPIFEVLTGATRGKARALARLEGDSDSRLLQSLSLAGKAGHRAFIIPLTLPGEGIRGRRFYRETRQLLDRLRAAAGEESDFALDCQGRLRPSQAASLARELESFRLLWLDEPSKDTADAARQRIAGESVTPVGLGRMATGMGDFQGWLRDGSLDVARPDVTLLGIDAIRKLAAHAETHYVALAPVVSGGPIASAAGLQLAATIPNFFVQEIPFPTAAEDRAMRKDLLVENVESVETGFLSLPTGPGLGITLNEDVLKRYQVTA